VCYLADWEKIYSLARISEDKILAVHFLRYQRAVRVRSRWAGAGFGAKSEKVLRQIEQLEFQLEELQAASAIEEAQAVAPQNKRAVLDK
jgi:hypothetical protein